MNQSLIRIFFLLFFFFGNMIVLKIFVGVSIINFKQIKKQVMGQAELSKD